MQNYMNWLNIFRIKKCVILKPSCPLSYTNCLNLFFLLYNYLGWQIVTKIKIKGSWMSRKNLEHLFFYKKRKKKKIEGNRQLYVIWMQITSKAYFISSCKHEKVKCWHRNIHNVVNVIKLIKRNRRLILSEYSWVLNTRKIKKYIYRDS